MAAITSVERPSVPILALLRECFDQGNRGRDAAVP